MPQTTKIQGELEIDVDRGVIYFHADDDTVDYMKWGGVTLLRICNLPTPIPEECLDVTHLQGQSWGEITLPTNFSVPELQGKKVRISTETSCHLCKRKSMVDRRFCPSWWGTICIHCG